MLQPDVRFGSLTDIAAAMELVRFVPEADMDRRGASLDAGFDHDGRREQDAAMIPLALSLRLPQPAVIRHGASRCLPIRWQLTG
jgi:hypothetical protein